MDKTKNKPRQRNHYRVKSDSFMPTFNYNTTRTETKVMPYIDDTDIKSTKSDEKSKSKPFITKMGFNMSEASLDEKMNYL